MTQERAREQQAAELQNLNDRRAGKDRVGTGWAQQRCGQGSELRDTQDSCVCAVSPVPPRAAL